MNLLYDEWYAYNVMNKKKYSFYPDLKHERDV